MQNPGYISERSSSWRDVAATWIIAAVVMGIVAGYGSLFGYRSQLVAVANPPVLTSAAEASSGKEDDRGRVYRVSARASVPFEAR